jgi:D-aspartate ligase
VHAVTEHGAALEAPVRSSVGTTVALVAAGHTMALAVVRALGEAGIPVGVLHYDDRDTAQASKYAVARIRVPHPLHSEQQYVDALIDVARAFGGSLLIPASDESVVAISRNRDVLAARYRVACPEWRVAERFIDKSQTYAIAARCGVPAPRTVVPRTEDDLDSAAAALGFPLLLKPAESHRFYQRFGCKLIEIDSAATLRPWYARTVAAGLAVTLQELIPGDDASVVNYNAYLVDGEPVAEFTARQLRKAPPHYGSPRVAVGEEIPEVIQPGRALLRAMEFEGFACIEFKLDRRDGVYKLMDVNGRHNLSGLLAVRSGINFPLLQYRHLVDGEIPAVGPAVYGRYWTDLFRDGGYSVARVLADRHSPAAYLRPYARPHCDAIIDRRDPGPAIARLRYIARHATALARSATGR